MIPRCKATPIALLTIVAGGCAGEQAEFGATVRDSAGVTIVEHSTVDTSVIARWALSSDALLRIGTVSGDSQYQFHRIQDVTRLEDGAVVVLDVPGRLRLFDSSGAYLWTSGGKGGGPGEFRYPVIVQEIGGDSLVVWDGVANRLSVFTRDGMFARDATASALDPPTVSWGLSGRRDMLVEARQPERTRIQGHAAVVHRSIAYLVNLEGEITRELGEIIFATSIQEVDENGAFSSAIFATSAVVAPSQQGMWHGDTRRYELRLETGTEGGNRIVRWSGPDRTIANRDVQAVVAKWSEGQSAEVRAHLAEYGKAHPRAESFPAYEKLIVDRTGRL